MQPRMTIWLHEQIALRRKAGKQHAMPVFVGDFGDEMINGLSVIRAQHLAQLPPVRAHEQFYLILGEMRRSFLRTDRKLWPHLTR